MAVLHHLFIRCSDTIWGATRSHCVVIRTRRTCCARERERERAYCKVVIYTSSLNTILILILIIFQNLNKYAFLNSTSGETLDMKPPYLLFVYFCLKNLRCRFTQSQCTILSLCEAKQHTTKWQLMWFVHVRFVSYVMSMDIDFCHYCYYLDFNAISDCSLLITVECTFPVLISFVLKVEIVQNLVRSYWNSYTFWSDFPHCFMIKMCKLVKYSQITFSKDCIRTSVRACSC